MKRLIGLSLGIAVLVGLLASTVSAEATVGGAPGAAGSFVHQTDGTAGAVYRYGPSIIMNGDGTGDAWFCAPSYTGPWDQIAHKQTSNYGVTWTNDTTVLQATAGSRDANSVCDPGAIKFGGYYYIGYTSTQDSRGTDNQAYVARSTSPTGPFEKWNGTGWGGNPQPMVNYSGAADSYGTGEPSFVIQGGVLYVYYTWSSKAADGSPINQTRVSTADPTNANWPGALTSHGIAMDKNAFAGSDSADVKYIDSLGKFVAVTTARRFTASAYLQFWESTDGFTFHPSNITTGYERPYLHNAGLSGDATGHIDISSTHNFVAYAFGPQWANWDTYENPITYTNDARPAPPRIESITPNNGSATLTFTPDSTVTGYTIRYGASSGSAANTVVTIATTATITGLTNGTRYYFSITAANGSATSDTSEEVYTTPENYVQVAPVSSQTSSSLPGHAATASYDGDPTTFYSSVGHSTSAAAEWVSYDLGSTQTLGRVTLTPRQPDGMVAPEYGRHFQIQASNDGVTWFAMNYREAGANQPLTVPVATRYVRLYADDLSADEYGNHYLQLGEVKFEKLGETAFSSSVTAGWEPYHLIDGDTIGSSSTFSSVVHATATATELVALDLGEAKSLTGLLLTPRAAGAGFPVDFSLQTSSDSTTWTNIPGQSYTSYANPGNTPVSFRFVSPVSTRYVRLTATRLGSDGSGNYALQMAQAQPLYNPTLALTASSSLPGFSPSAATDGNPATFYSSIAHSTANATEALTLDLGAATAVSRIRVTPRIGYAFPSALTIDYSTDGITWSRVPGQTYEKFYNPADANTSDNIDPYPLFDFRSIVTAQYFRISATQLRTDNGASYYFQLADVQVNP